MSVHSILYLLFRYLARSQRPALAARLLLLTTRRFRTLGKPASLNRDGHRVLILTHEGFTEDALESFRDAEDFEVIRWPRYALKAFSAALLSPKLDHNNYVSDDPDIVATKTAYRRFLSEMWRHYRGVKPVDAVLTGNFAYFTEREFGTVVEATGTPFIALHKENVRPPRRIKEYWFTLYKERRGKFTGRKILVYNDIERELEIATGIVKPKNVVVTGMPRLDWLHRWRREHAGPVNGSGPPKVLFFAFSRYDKLTAIERKPSAGLDGNVEDMEGDWGKLSWGKFAEDTHRAICELARVRPDFEVFIKSKGKRRVLTDIQKMLADMEEPQPPNLKFVVGGIPFDLITESRVVVGFNTTGLLEAIAAGKPVIVPRFGEALEESMQDLIIDLGDAVHYANSPEDLGRLICKFAEQPAEIPGELPPKTSEVLRHWVGNDDGAAGRRVLEAINHEFSDGNRQ